MKKVLFLISISFFLNCNNSVQENSKVLEKILSKKYNLEFSIESIFLNAVNGESVEKINGLIKRENEYVYSKSSFGFGVKEDSLCIYVDDDLKSVDLDGPLTMGPKLVLWFYDPLAIYNYGLRYNNFYRRQSKNSLIKHNFGFADTIPVIQILIEETKNDNSFVIEITYYSLGDKIKDVINYKIISDDVNKETIKIKDFVQEENGKFVLRHEHKNLKDYTFFNALPLESIFK